ncbi:hypothetical protein P7C73_g5024, partial [Tremellales sp. Uapishka_1]
DDSAKKKEETMDETAAPTRRGFDALLDAGLSADDVAMMRRQFYESRGEEVPDGLEGGLNDEHARALEEQWIEGDLTQDTATTSSEGLYTSILHGLLTGFMLPLTPWVFFRELPLPNFFDTENGEDERGGTTAEVPVSSVVFGKRMQMGIMLGTILNLTFGVLRYLN